MALSGSKEHVFRLTLSRLSVRRLKNGPKLKAAVLEAMEDVWFGAAAEFVKVLSTHTLVETGESVAGLEPLARFVRATLVYRTPIKSNVKKPSLNLKGKRDGTGNRSTHTGRRKGAKAYLVSFGAKGAVFRFQIPIFQQFLHDTGRASNSKPVSVNATSKALAAHRRFVRQGMARIQEDLVNTWIRTGAVITFKSESAKVV